MFGGKSEKEVGNCSIHDANCNSNSCNILLHCNMMLNERCQYSYPETATMPCTTYDFQGQLGTKFELFFLELLQN